MALLEHRRHKHDVVAKTRCRLDVLDSGSLGAPWPPPSQSSWKAFGNDEPSPREDRKRKVGAKD
jgi:hypothetical protein